jgi:hypothetical protein
VAETEAKLRDLREQLAAEEGEKKAAEEKLEKEKTEKKGS